MSGRHSDTEHEDGHDAASARPADSHPGDRRRAHEHDGASAREPRPSSPRAGSGNYAAEWIGDLPRVHAGPDHQRGGGFGGPQDSESRGEPPADAPPREVTLPGEVPGAREAVARGAEPAQREERTRDAPSSPCADDAHLRARVCERLHDEPHLEASRVSVEAKDGKVYLDGQVPTPEMKSRIGALVAECGVVAIHNRLHIVDRRRPRTESEHPA